MFFIDELKSVNLNFEPIEWQIKQVRIMRVFSIIFFTVIIAVLGSFGAYAQTLDLTFTGSHPTTHNGTVNVSFEVPAGYDGSGWSVDLDFVISGVYPSSLTVDSPTYVNFDSQITGSTIQVYPKAGCSIVYNAGDIVTVPILVSIGWNNYKFWDEFS